MQPILFLFARTVKFLPKFNLKNDTFALNILGEEVYAHIVKGKINNIHAEVTGEDNGVPVAVQQDYGQGKIIWIPSLLGIYAKEDSESMAKHIGKLNLYENILVTETLISDVLISKINVVDKKLILFINQGMQPVTIKLNPNITVEEVIFGKEIKSENSLNLESAAVLLISD